MYSWYPLDVLIDLRGTDRTPDHLLNGLTKYLRKVVQKFVQDQTAFHYKLKESFVWNKNKIVWMFTVITRMAPEQTHCEYFFKSWTVGGNFLDGLRQPAKSNTFLSHPNFKENISASKRI